MTSPVITTSQRQLTLPLDDTLLDAHSSLRECVAAGVYQRGLKRVAGDLDLAPGNLSVALSADPQRKFSVDELEAYLSKHHDWRPIYYLIAKYLGDQGANRDHALGQVAEVLQNLPNMLAAAGFPTQGKGRR